MSLRPRPRPKKAARALPLRFDTLESRQLLSTGATTTVGTSGAAKPKTPVVTTPPPKVPTTPTAVDWTKVYATPYSIIGPALTAPTKATSSSSATPGISPAISGNYTPAQIRHAYGFDQLPYDGTGQTIAIVDAYGSPTIAADLAQFDTAFNLPAPPALTIAQPQGPTGTNAGWAGETSLDVEWAHAIAPGATILLVETASASFANLLGGVDYAVSQGSDQVSMSFGGPEIANDTSLDSHFQVPGVTFFASSGDTSAGAGTTSPVVSYPAASPYVTSVGGTSLVLNGPGNTRSSETVWGDGNLADEGTGGGYSTVEAKPVYQSGFVTGTARGVPDVSYNADPNTGLLLFENGVEFGGVGGTSAGSPQWAGLAALVNQGRQANGRSPLGSGNSFNSDPAIYATAGTGSYTNTGGDFFDVTSGSNGYPATVGWDPSTGLGTPVADKLVPALVGPIIPQTPGTLKDGFFSGYTVSGSGSAGYRYDPAGSAWTYTGTAGLSKNGSAFTSNNPASPAGPQVAFVQGTGAVSQTINNLTAGGYQVTFSAAQRGNYQASQEDIQVTLDGIVVGTFTPTGLAYNSYATTLFSVSAGNHVLGFQGLDTAGGDNTALIGNVTLGLASNTAPALGDSGLESPVLAGGSAVADPSGTAWTFSGPAGIATNGSAYTTGNPSTPDGSQVAFVEQQGSLAQSPTGWLAGSYQITFFAAQRASVNPKREDFQLLIDGAVVGSFTPLGTTYQTYSTAPFTVTAGQHSITFKGLDTAGGDNTALVDGVVASLQKVTASVVPSLVAAPSVGDIGFESVSVGSGGFLLDPAGSAWTFAGQSGIAANNSTYTSSNPTAPDGSQVAFVENQGSFSQSVANWTAGTYMMSFSSAQRGVLQASREDFEVLIDGNIINTFAPTSSGYMTYWTAPFTVTAGAHTITFQGFDSATNDNTALIDGIAVVPTS